MSNNFYSPHPEDDRLLSYSDNELEGSTARSVRKHLKECWRCRTQLEDLQTTVTGFMRYREHTLVPNLPAPPQPWKNLKADFDRVDRENANLADRSRLFARFGPLPAMRTVSRIAVGIAAVAVIGFGYGYYYILRPETPPAAPVKQETPSISAPASTAPAALSAKVEIAAQPAPGPVIAPPPPIQLIDAEVAVAVALHRAGADLGEPIEVVREPNRVVVTGTALSAGRREELTTALAAIPGVSIRWEDTRITRNPSRPNANFDAGRLPWQAELEAALGGKAALERTSNELLDLSDSVTARTAALKKLRDQFAGASLASPEQSKIDSIGADHQRELRKAVDALNRRAAPVFEKLGVTAAEAGLSGSASPRVSVYEAAQKTDQLLNVLFAGAETNRSLPQTLEDLRNAMSRLRLAAAAN